MHITERLLAVLYNVFLINLMKVLVYSLILHPESKYDQNPGTYIFARGTTQPVEPGAAYSNILIYKTFTQTLVDPYD